MAYNIIHEINAEPMDQSLWELVIEGEKETDLLKIFLTKISLNPQYKSMRNSEMHG